jgi:hypothetical protein
VAGASKPRRHKSPHAVYILIPPPDWRPSSPWAYPPIVTGGTLYARHICARDAKAICRAHNLGQLKRTYQNLPVESWTVFAPSIRPRHGAKGGAL